MSIQFVNDHDIKRRRGLFLMETIACGLLAFALYAQEHPTSSTAESPQRAVPVARDPWAPQHSGVAVSLRGLAAVSESCCWASGAQGTVIRTTDGGKSWQVVSPAGAQLADFRDIQAWDDSTAVVMSSGEIDRLYRTENGGRTWLCVFEHRDPLAFFDGMAFDASGQHGWLMGDPIDGKIFLLRTSDGGKTWCPLPDEKSPAVLANIAAFAASGTHLICPNRETILIGLGGGRDDASEPQQAMVLITKNGGAEWLQATTPIRARSSAGIFSMTAINVSSKRLVAVGGDYLNPAVNQDNVVVSEDGGGSWRLPRGSFPGGYRSAIVSIPTRHGSHLLLASGPNGTDQSKDEGETWTPVSQQGFHALSFVSPSVGWAAGSDGRLARWNASM